MKIRNGFVSNSSSSSFTIYGWTETELFGHLTKLSPLFSGIELHIDEYRFLENLEEYWFDEDRDMVCSSNADGVMVFGVGQSGGEIDHYLPDNTDWRDFKYPEPNDDKKKELDKLAKRFNLPAPSMHQGTFYDG